VNRAEWLSDLNHVSILKQSLLCLLAAFKAASPSNNATLLQLKMTIYNLWIFSEKGTLLFYREWLRKNHTSMDKEEVI